MATLHVRGIPDDLMELVKQKAQLERRSVGAEVTVLLRRGLCEPAASQASLLALIRQLRFRPPAGTPSTTEMLREDRER